MLNHRYSRHALIDWFSQERVQNARFVVTGAGAIGNEVIKNLALLGAGHIAIHDFDRIEQHNLTRSVLFREGDIGRHKAEVAAHRACELDPAVRATAVAGDFWETLSFATLRHADCVLGCVDNFEARIRLNRLCRLTRTNLIDVAIDTRHASVEVFPFAAVPSCACYECTLPAGVYTRIAQRYSCAGLRRRGLVERLIPTTILTSSAAGALAVSSAMRLLHAPQEARGAHRILMDTIGATSSMAPLVRSETCPGCADLMSAVRIVPCDPVIGSAELRDAVPGPDVSLRLSDALVSGGRCTSCGYDLNDAGLNDVGPPQLLLARDQDDGLSRCPKCGGDMALSIGEQFTPGDLEERFPGQRLPARFALVDSDETSVVLDFAACQFPAARSSGE
jgi:molybdopterin/thiamine biosynthesis adenylyltransferase